MDPHYTVAQAVSTSGQALAQRLTSIQHAHQTVAMQIHRVKTRFNVSQLLISMMLVAGCTGIEPHAPLETVPSVDLARYAGTWHEIARLPMWFQRHCLDSKAIYTIRPDGQVGVHNECLTKGGTTDQADGVASVVDLGTNARLTVLFDNWFAKLAGSSREGNYWILDLDQDYRTALVGTPDRRYLWILSRTPQLDKPTYQRLLDKAKQLGFPIEDLITARRPAPPS